MNNFKITGTIHAILDEQRFSEKFSKRDFVLEIEDGAYKQYAKFQLVNDRIDLLTNYTIGDRVTVSFNLRGRPYDKHGETVYFTNLESWRIERDANTPNDSKPNKQSLRVKKVEPLSQDNDFADLPF